MNQIPLVDSKLSSEKVKTNDSLQQQVEAESGLEENFIVQGGYSNDNTNNHHELKVKADTVVVGTMDQQQPVVVVLPMNIEDGSCKSYTLIAKYGKQVLTFDDLTGDVTIGEVKLMIENETRILSKRQKLVGLQVASTNSSSSNKGLVSDEIQLSELKIKSTTMGNNKGKSDPNNRSNNSTSSTTMDVVVHQFILMGTPEDAIFIDPSQRTIPDVIDDFDLDCNAGTDEWYNHVANTDNLRKFTEQTPIHIMNEPRSGKPLLVLDLDHTLLDFSSRMLQRTNSNDAADFTVAESMKRPYMDHFLATCYPYYDMVVWSQTSWRWLETKLIELGMITNPNYKFCFVLDKTSMFTITSTLKKGTVTSNSIKKASASLTNNNNNGGKAITHHVKPLQIIWSKFADRWGVHNTVHVDDLSRNFALNLQSGLKIKAYYRKRASSGRRDVELLGLGNYLVQLAQCTIPFNKINFAIWSDVATGKRQLVQQDDDDDDNNNNNTKKDKSKR